MKVFNSKVIFIVNDLLKIIKFGKECINLEFWYLMKIFKFVW